MDVMINGDNRALEPQTTVGMLVEDALSDRPSLDGVAVALNEEVVPRSGWETTALSEGDRVEILTAREGG